MTDLEKAAVDYARALAEATQIWGNDPRRAVLDELLHSALSRLTEQAVLFAARSGGAFEG